MLRILSPYLTAIAINFRFRWHPYGYHQQTNYDALVTTPEFDRVIRHPKILAAIEQLMGGPVCFGEIGARYMPPYDGKLHRSWHRDRPHWDEHPFRMDYIQLMLYLTDVGADTHCFSLSPESVYEPALEDKDAQLKRGGIADIHGPAGTVCLFNVAALHTATTRPTTCDRKTLQIYYGHRDRKYLANDSVIPPIFWRDHKTTKCVPFTATSTKSPIFTTKPLESSPDHGCNISPTRISSYSLAHHGTLRALWRTHRHCPQRVHRPRPGW